ncbi:MAG: hypothetical protein LBU90_08350 [Bacteroidales bacterium]|jgi:sugar lactone lactonase YvrE|nr:hypothetical protein [Bacteroidales bacterium]
MKKTILNLAAACTIACSACTDKKDLILVAESNYQWTGVAVSQEERIFVNYPAWDVPSPFQVAELIDGKEVAYPSQEAQKLFSCVQSVVIDAKNRLWVLDPANPQFGGVVPEGPKLFRINLQTNEIEKTYSFTEGSYSRTSYLNDVRVDTNREIAYITDSEDGGLVVLDLTSGKSWLALDSTCPAVRANLDAVDFKSTGRWEVLVHSDGLELSKDNSVLYFTSLTADILYEIPTAVLRDTTLTSPERCGQVVVLNAKNVPTDGLVLHNNILYMADLPAEGVWAFDLATKQGKTLNFGKTIRWADSFARGGDDYIYFTTSQINYPIEKRVKYEVFKFKGK